MAKTTPTKYSTGPDAYLYIETQGQLRSQINGVLVLSVLFSALCWAVLALRMYVRAFMLRSVGTDDWWLLVTMIIFTAYALTLIIACSGLLQNIPEYAAGQVPTSLAIPQLVIAGYCLYCAVTIAFKISLGYFFLKIFSNRKAWRITIWVSMILPGLLGIFNVGWTAKYPCQLESVFFAGLESCGEFKARTDWAVVAALWAGVSAITDLLYGVLSFLAIKSLQMPWKTRITAALLCSLGCVGGVAACVRLYFLIAQVPNLSVLGEALHTAIWSVIEPGLAIFAASFASLRPLWMKMKDPNWTPTGHTSRTPVATGRQNTNGQAGIGRIHQEGSKDRILVSVELSQV